MTGQIDPHRAGYDKMLKQTELEDDARRWRFVRDHLTEVVESMAGNPMTHAFRFQMPRKRGETIDEVIDKMIFDQRLEEADAEVETWPEWKRNVLGPLPPKRTQ